MKTLLIYPYICHPFPTPYFPLGVGYLASYLRKKEFRVEIIDMANCRISIRGLIQEIKRIKPDFVGFTVNYSSLETCIKISKQIKDINNSIKIIFGGPWPTFIPDKLLKEVQEIDYIIRNEGEITLCELVKGVFPERIKGLSFRSNGNVVSNPSRPLIRNIDSLPSPYLNNIYDFTKYKVATLITARGCSNKCLFCSAREIFFNQVRYHKIERIIEEIDMLYHSGIREFVVIDDSFFYNRDHAKIILESFIKRYPNSSIECQLRFDVINGDTLKIMKKAGVHVLNFGLESMSEKTLQRIRKGTDPAMIEKVLKMVKKSGIKSIVNLIVGLPGEGIREVKETIQFAKRLEADLYVLHIIRLYPGTDIYNNSKEYGFSFIEPGSIYLRRARTNNLTYAKMWELLEFGNKEFSTTGFYEKVLTSEKIDLYNIHPMRCLL